MEIFAPKEIIDYFPPFTIMREVEGIKKQNHDKELQVPLLYHRCLRATNPTYNGDPFDHFGEFCEVIRKHLFEDIKTPSAFRRQYMREWKKEFPFFMKRSFWNDVEEINFSSFNDPKQYFKQAKNIREITKAIRKSFREDPRHYYLEPSFKQDYEALIEENQRRWIKKRAIELLDSYFFGYYGNLDRKKFSERKMFLKTPFIRGAWFRKILRMLVFEKINKEKS